jgi:4-amino-4-deoxy-L-arabinose transferase-like glycosyltransferase
VRRRLPSFPLVTFAWTRAAIFLAAPLAYLVLQAQGHGPNGGPVPARIGAGSGWAIDLWGRWDGGWFLRIVQHGYAEPHFTAAFFPLYPLLVRVLAWPLAGRDVLAGVLVSLAASAVAVVLLYELVRELLDEDDAKRSVVYLLVFPTTLFLCAVYSESLYLALSVGTFLAATRGKWLTAGILCGLAMLTRSAGVVLLVPLVLIAWRSSDRSRALTRAAVALPIAAVWPLYLWIRFSDPILFLHAQHDHFGRHLSAGGPFGGVWYGLVAGWNGIRQLFGPAGSNYFPQATDYPPAYTAAVNLEALGFAILVIVLGVAAWQRLGAPYGVFVLGSMLLPLAAPTADYPLLSLPRFALGIFPIFIVLATLGRRRSPDLAITSICALYLGINLARWVLYAWVA